MAVIVVMMVLGTVWEKAGQRWQRKHLCVTHLEPSAIVGILDGLAAAIDLLTLAWGSEIVSAVGSGSLPVLHLDDRGGRK